MADSFEGDLDLSPVTSSQSNKVATFNASDLAIEHAAVGRMVLDAGGLTGTKTLTSVESRRGEVDVTGSKSGALTIQFDDNIKQAWWVRDSTTDGANVIFKSVGGGDNRVLPKLRWTLIRTRTTTIDQMAGWQDSSLAPALSFGAAYQVVSGRALKIYKNGADMADAAGRVTMEGAVEETTTIPAAGDTIVTLPADYRPAHTIAFAVTAEAGSAANVDFVAIEITTAGLVILRSVLAWTAAINVPIDLSGISFFAAN